MPEVKRPLKVFLCHASADKPKVRELYRTLKRRGVQPWLDAEDLIPGQKWEVEIPKALLSSDAIIICLTPNSVDKEGYVQKEIKFALDKAMEMPEGRIFLIPARLEECDLPFSLSKYQAVNMYEKAGYAKLMQALKLRASQLECSTVELPKAGETTAEIKKVVEEKKPPDPQEDKPETKTPKPSVEKVGVGGDIKDSVIVAGSGNVINFGNQEKTEPEQTKPEKLQPKKTKPRKPNTAIIIALIGLAGTVIAGLLNSPLIEKWFVPVAVTFQPAFMSTLPSDTNRLTILSPTPLPSLEYNVRDRDTCQTISVRFRVSITDINELNGSGSFCEQLKPNDVIKIPAYAINVPLTRTVSPTETQVVVPTPTPLPSEIKDHEGVTMRFVPAGIFTMGSDRYSDEEKPVHTVRLDAYYIDKYEVTNVAYKRCVDAGVCNPPNQSFSSTRTVYYGKPEFDEFPVIYVDWNMAKTYCEWHGDRLPTEAEWEKAARGTIGGKYPWGERIDCDKANYSNCKGDTTKVGSYLNGVSPYGVYDMAGNVWEWVADWYSETYYQNSPSENPLGPNSGQYRVLRGGAWNYVDSSLRVSSRLRLLPDYFGNGFGFRCAKDANP